MIVNGYLLDAWLELITDFGEEPFVYILPDRTDRPIDFPMDFIPEGEMGLMLNLSPRTTGYCNIDKEEGYLSFSTRFNKISHDLMIPIEAIALIQSKCGTIKIMLPEAIQELPVKSVDPTTAFRKQYMESSDAEKAKIVQDVDTMVSVLNEKNITITNINSQKQIEKLFGIPETDKQRNVNIKRTKTPKLTLGTYNKDVEVTEPKGKLTLVPELPES